jgi:hypothetical protein
MHTKHRTLATVATVQCSSTTAQAQSNKIDPGLKRRSRLLSILYKFTSCTNLAKFKIRAYFPYTRNATINSRDFQIWRNKMRSCLFSKNMIVQIYDIHTVRYFYLVKIVRSTNTVRSYRRKSITGGKFHQYDQASQWWEGT